jgi:hypothetical protein
VIVYTLFGMSPTGALVAAPLGAAWHDFYLMAGTAAVTLVGLLFVALSLHVEILFKREHRDFRELAAEAFQGYLYVLITALAFLIPLENGAILALMYAAINVVMLIRTGFRAPSFFAAHRARGGSTRRRWRFFVPALAYLLGLLAVFQWLSGGLRAGVGFFTPVVMMLAASTRTAWDLLEYVGKVRSGEVNTP